MRILIIQLARLGDVLLTWPQVRALKRLFPEAEIDMLVRPRFKEATVGLSCLNKVIEFPMDAIFEPLLSEPLQPENSLKAIDDLISTLVQNNYEWIINSTLSPASSYLTYSIAQPSTKVTGYSRTTDGYLAIKDEVSAYIYAQVGVDRDNRIHLADLFTLMIGAQPCLQDWITEAPKSSALTTHKYAVIHVGASRADKRFSPFKWRAFITYFQKLESLPLILIGGVDDIQDAEFISLGFDPSQVQNQTGQMNFPQLFPLIASAAIYIGCDSAPLHIASLVGTPSLNVSLATVNFWETGPRALGSRVLYAETEADLPSEKVALAASQILRKETPTSEMIFSIDHVPSYTTPPNTRNKDWTWNLIFALYMGGDWPPLESATLIQALKNLTEVNKVILAQLDTIKKTRTTANVSAIIERCEDVIESVGVLVPELQPLIRWYQTQKAQIGPGSPLSIFEATEKVHVDFEAILLFWQKNDLILKEEFNGSPQSEPR